MTHMYAVPATSAWPFRDWLAGWPALPPFQLLLTPHTRQPEKSRNPPTHHCNARSSQRQPATGFVSTGQRRLQRCAAQCSAGCDWAAGCPLVHCLWRFDRLPSVPIHPFQQPRRLSDHHIHRTTNRLRASPYPSPFGLVFRKTSINNPSPTTSSPVSACLDKN